VKRNASRIPLRLAAVVALAGAARPSEDPFPPAKPEEVGLRSTELAKLVAEVRRWADAGEIVGAEILVVKDRRTVLHEAIGFADAERRRPLRRDAIFRMRSLTWPFTATAALRLVDEEIVSLVDRVGKHLPAFDNARSHRITVGQLFTHTSGLLPSSLPEPFSEYPVLRAAVDAAGWKGPSLVPGAAYRPSPLNPAILASLTQRITGVPFEQFLREQVLEPIGLEDTHARFDPGADWADRVTRSSVWGPAKRAFVPVAAPELPYFRGDDGLYSTVSDTARFLAVWMDRGRIGEKKRMLSELLAREALLPGPRGPYGYGFAVPLEGDLGEPPPLFGHAAEGMVALAYPLLDAMVLYFTPSVGNDRSTRFALLAGDVLGAEGPSTLVTLPVRVGFEPAALDDAARAAYTGTFRAQGIAMTVTVRDGVLAIEGPAGRFHLVPRGDERFAIGWYRDGRPAEVTAYPEFTIRFRREGERVAAFDLFQDGTPAGTAVRAQ